MGFWGILFSTQHVYSQDAIIFTSNFSVKKKKTSHRTAARRRLLLRPLCVMRSKKKKAPFKVGKAGGRVTRASHSPPLLKVCP